MRGRSAIRFSIDHRDGATHARAGTIETPHGTVRTPAFMPVGTQGTVKALTPDQVRESGTEMILGNTYHLSLRPGEEIVREAGGLHRFMGWEGSILTDSGGFQVFSLASLRKVIDGGVEFRSHIDGELIRLSPERAVAIQNALGADIIMVLDHCAPYPVKEKELEEACARTLLWAERCAAAHARDDQALFAIVQGGIDLDRRVRMARDLAALNFPGYAIGGVSVGEDLDQVRRVVAATAPLLPAERPRYLMGVGSALEMLEGIAAGVDMFDCVLATRNARNAFLFTRSGAVRIRNKKYEKDMGPLDPSCRCTTCRKFTRAYLRHLYGRGEILAATLGSLHNLQHFQDLMAEARGAIAAGRFPDLLASARARPAGADPDEPEGAAGGPLASEKP